jgi:hypothetical protein
MKSLQPFSRTLHFASGCWSPDRLLIRSAELLLSSAQRLDPATSTISCLNGMNISVHLLKPCYLQVLQRYRPGSNISQDTLPTKTALPESSAPVFRRDDELVPYVTPRCLTTDRCLVRPMWRPDGGRLPSNATLKPMPLSHSADMVELRNEFLFPSISSCGNPCHPDPRRQSYQHYAMLYLLCSRS